MTRFKVGDRVKLKSHTAGWWGGNLGKIGTVVAVGRWNSFNVKFDNSKGHIWEVDRGDGSDLELVSTTPPITIQHGGYNYTRGEPVVPEWVKDGAWVVHKESGEIGQVRVCILGETVFSPLSEKFRDNVSNILVIEHYRPFTNEDWKWGMWAEYKGEKVFVQGVGLSMGLDGVFASRPGNGYFPVPFSEITPTTAP